MRDDYDDVVGGLGRGYRSNGSMMMMIDDNGLSIVFGFPSAAGLGS